MSVTIQKLSIHWQELEQLVIKYVDVCTPKSYSPNVDKQIAFLSRKAKDRRTFEN
jgi:hypothetical protein